MDRLNPFRSFKSPLAKILQLEDRRMRQVQSALITPIDRVRQISLTWFSTIRARLYCAFGFTAVLTIVCSLVAIAAFLRIGSTTYEIVSSSLPATVISLRLAEEASSLVSSAPRLMTETDEKTRAEIAERIETQAKTLAQGIDHLKALGIANTNDFNVTRIALLERLSALSQIVSYRITISNERNALASSIRPAHEALLDSLAPAIDDANFDLMTKDKQAGLDSTLNATLESLRRLLEIQSESNLLAGLLTEASLVSDSNKLEPLRDLIAAAKRKIEINLSQIGKSAQKQKLATLYKQLADIGADDGVVELRAFELDRQRDAQVAFKAAQTEAIKLKNTVDALVGRQGEDAQKQALSAKQEIRSGQMLLIVLMLVATIGAALIAWLYVGRNIAHRLGHLSNAMRRIADGDLDVYVEDNRDDEIADMARALRFFREATADAVAARNNEIEQARTSEFSAAFGRDRYAGISERSSDYRPYTGSCGRDNGSIRT